MFLTRLGFNSSGHYGDMTQIDLPDGKSQV
ncbi:MAG: hypothetical protein ACLSB9_20165 [Hydrogeniiclostridium mannosilyticum]